MRSAIFQPFALNEFGCVLVVCFQDLETEGRVAVRIPCVLRAELRTAAEA